MKNDNGAESLGSPQNPYTSPVATVADSARLVHLKQALLGLVVSVATQVAMVVAILLFSGDEIALNRTMDNSVMAVVAIITSLPFLLLRVRWYWIVLSAPFITLVLLVAAAIVIGLLGGW